MDEEHTDQNPETSEFLAAVWALDKNDIKVTPVQFKDKAPILDGWERTDLMPEDIIRYWGNGNPYNVGIRLGDPSGGRVDVDLDVEEAVEIAPRFLENTKTSGHEGESPTHYWYVSPGTPTKKFMPIAGTQPFKAILELRSTNHQTIAPPSVYENGDRCVWFNPGQPMSRVPPGELMHQVSKLATATLIARNLPNESRHDIGMALCSILMGRKLDRLPEDEVLDILSAAWDAAGYPKGKRAKAQKDLRNLVRDTKRKLERGDKVRGLPSLQDYIPGLGPRILDYWEWNSAPENAQDDNDDDVPTLERVKLGEAITKGIPDPQELVDDVLLEHKTHIVYGPSGSGKSFLVLWCILQVMAQDKSVVLFDAENGKRTTAKRLEAMGADPQMLDKYLHYYPHPSLHPTPVTEIVDDINPALVVYDPLIYFLGSEGLNENQPIEVQFWFSKYVEPVKARETTVLITEHMPIDAVRIRGAGRKRDAADVAWYFSAPQPFDRDTVGLVMLARDKDREGWLPQVVKFTAGGLPGGRTIFERSGVLIETIDPGTGLTPKVGKVYEVLQTFGAVGAVPKDLEKILTAPQTAPQVSRRKMYSALKELTSGDETALATQHGNRYFAKSALDCTTTAPSELHTGDSRSAASAGGIHIPPHCTASAPGDESYGYVTNQDDVEDVIRRVRGPGGDE